MAIDLGPILSNINSLCEADGASISEAVFAKYLLDASFAQHHEIMTGVRNGKMIPIIDAKPDYGFLKVSPGDCQTNTCDYDATSSDKKWHPADYSCRVPICKETLDCDFRKFWGMRCKDFDDENDAFMQFLIEKIMESVNSSQWRIGYFDSLANANPDFAGIDGLFAQWLALAPVGSPNRFEIPENALATIPAQMALDPARGYDVLKEMYDYAAVNIPHILTTPGIHFDITPVLAYNYLAYLRDNKEVNCCFNTANDGITSSGYAIENLNYLGIPIDVRNEWRNIIEWQATESGATNYDNPHRAVLTYRGNKPVGTCDTEAFEKFRLFYDEKDLTLLIDVGSSFDTKVIIDTDFVLAM